LLPTHEALTTGLNVSVVPAQSFKQFPVLKQMNSCRDASMGA
jgi:hypothetical protein